MTVEIVPQKWVFSCDCCGVKETSPSALRPSKWVGIIIDQCAVDWGGNPCADASVSLMLCRDCGLKATSAMNAAFAAIQSPAEEKKNE